MTDDKTYADVAEEVAEDAGMDSDTAIRRLMALQINVLEIMMVSLWGIEESLQLRTEKPKNGAAPKHDA